MPGDWGRQGQQGHCPHLCSVMEVGWGAWEGGHQSLRGPVPGFLASHVPAHFPRHQPPECAGSTCQRTDSARVPSKEGAAPLHGGRAGSSGAAWACFTPHRHLSRGRVRPARQDAASASSGGAAEGVSSPPAQQWLPSSKGPGVLCEGCLANVWGECTEVRGRREPGQQGRVVWLGTLRASGLAWLAAESGRLLG